MDAALAARIVNLLGIYALLGVVFAVAFVTAGVHRVDSSARGAGIGFRLLILPGVAALWPILALRWMRASGSPPVERNAHRRAAKDAGGAA